MLPRFRRGAFALFALAFFVTMLLGDRAALHLSLQPSELLAGRQWWTPLSAMFRYGEGLGMLGLLWTLLVQWGMGSRLEGFWGTARYLIMVLVAGLVGYGGAIGLALVVPDAGGLVYTGMGPLDTAAVVAFAWVFAGERLQVWFKSPRSPADAGPSREGWSKSISPVLVAAIAAPITLGFPLLVTVLAGTPVGAAWPTLVPGLLAGVVATLFVQPWRRREKSGKVGRENRRGQAHLRVVRTADDMLN